MKTHIIVAVATFFLHSTSLAEVDCLASEYDSAMFFAGFLGLHSTMIATNHFTWGPPASFVSGNITNVLKSQTRFDLQDCSRFGVDYMGNGHSFSASVCVCSNSTVTLRELCLPLVAYSSAPIDFLADSYVAITNSYGSNCIHRKVNSESIDPNFVRLCHGNIVLSVDGENPMELALALLRAGGVNIPDETQPEP